MMNEERPRRYFDFQQGDVVWCGNGLNRHLLFDRYAPDGRIWLKDRWWSGDKAPAWPVDPAIVSPAEL